MDVYIAILAGVYRHDILGVFLSLEGAIATSESELKSEPDDYHSVEIVRMVIGEPEEHIVGRVMRKDRYFENGKEVSRWDRHGCIGRGIVPKTELFRDF